MSGPVEHLSIMEGLWSALWLPNRAPRLALATPSRATNTPCYTSNPSCSSTSSRLLQTPSRLFWCSSSSQGALRLESDMCELGRLDPCGGGCGLGNDLGRIHTLTYFRVWSFKGGQATTCLDVVVEPSLVLCVPLCYPVAWRYKYISSSRLDKSFNKHLDTDWKQCWNSRASSQIGL